MSDDMLQRAREMLEQKQKESEELKKRIQEYNKLSFVEKLNLPENKSMKKRFEEEYKIVFIKYIKDHFPDCEENLEDFYCLFLSEFFNNKTRSVHTFLRDNGYKRYYDEDTFPELNEKFKNNEIGEKTYWEMVNVGLGTTLNDEVKTR